MQNLGFWILTMVVMKSFIFQNRYVVCQKPNDVLEEDVASFGN
jgi:hypothetical protein